MMLKVGITGGIGSGKTTVCKIFESIGVPVYYADSAAKRLMYKNAKLKAEIKKLLGPEAYHKNGRPNRAYIASVIFNDKKKLEAINSIVHPAVNHDAEQWHKKQISKYTIKEAALLVENASYKQLDLLIVVTCPIELRIKRILSRDKTNYEYVKKRMDSQLPESEKKKVANYIIDNSGAGSLISQVWRTHRDIIQQIEK